MDGRPNIRMQSKLCAIEASLENISEEYASGHIGLSIGPHHTLHHTSYRASSYDTLHECKIAMWYTHLMNRGTDEGVVMRIVYIQHHVSVAVCKPHL